MLPDFPKLKSDIFKHLLEFLQRRIDYHLGPLSELPHITLFEGEGRSTIRISGEAEESNMKRIQAELVIKDDELPTMNLGRVLEKLEEMAQSMAKQMAQHAYASISNALEKVGNVVDAKQMKMSAELILNLFSKISIEFSSDGRPQMPSIHIHPDLLKAVQLAIDELEKNPDLQKQFREIMEAKREEWRAREASRDLVG